MTCEFENEKDEVIFVFKDHQLGRRRFGQNKTKRNGDIKRVAKWRTGSVAKSKFNVQDEGKEKLNQKKK